MVAENQMDGRIYDIVAVGMERQVGVELDRDVGRNTVFVVVSVKSQRAGDAEPIVPTVGQYTHSGQPHAAASGVAQQMDVVVGLCGNSESACSAETTAVGKHIDGEVETGGGVGLGGESGLQGAEVVVARTVLYLAAVYLLAV